MKPYEPPTPAFGPGSVAYIQKQTEALELATLQDDVKSTTTIETSDSIRGESQDDNVGPRSGKSYAGAGSYF